LLVAEVCKLYSINKLNATLYHPQTDGLVECLNSTLCQTLSMFVSKNPKDWDVFMPAALFAFRTSPSESTGKIPFYLLYGGKLDYQWMSACHPQGIQPVLYLNISVE